MDLGSVIGDLDLPSYNDEPEKTPTYTPEADPMGLPFKPHIVGSVAKEIDASIHSHSPLHYILKPAFVSTPHYADVISRLHLPLSQVQQDPRLKKYAHLYRPRPDEGGGDAYSPTQQTVDLAPKNSNGVAKMSRRDPRRRD